MSPAGPYKIGIVTAYPPKTFHSTVSVIEDHGHIADVIEWKRVIPALMDNSLSFLYDGQLKAGDINSYDLIFNHFCGVRVSYYYFAFKAVCSAPMVNDWQGVMHAGDKMKTLINARDSSIHIPNTVLLNNVDFDSGIRCAEERLGYPMIMKETSSDNGERVHLVHNRHDAWEIWNQGGRHDLFLLQEYVRGDHLRVVVLGDRVLYSAKNRIAPGEFRANARYNCGVERYLLSESDQQLMVGVARKLGLDLVGLDVIKRPEGLCLLEANAKPGMQCDARILEEGGLDVYREIGLYLLNKVRIMKCVPSLAPLEDKRRQG